MRDNMSSSSRNLILARLVNKDGEGFAIYLIPKDKRKYNDLYLLKIRGSIKKNKVDIYFREWEVIDLLAVLTSGLSKKRYLDLIKRDR